MNSCRFSVVKVANFLVIEANMFDAIYFKKN